MVKIKMVTTPNAGKAVEKLGYSDTADENVKYAPAPGNSLAGSCEAKCGISI